MRHGARLRQQSRKSGNFKARCLERIYVLIRLATDNCTTGYPVAASLLARGVVETAARSKISNGLAMLGQWRTKEGGLAYRR
jgi:hypothetical protein